MAEIKRPLPPSWEGPLPKTTETVVRVVTKATKAVVEPIAKPVGHVAKPVGRKISHVVGLNPEYTPPKRLLGFMSDIDGKPISPREGPNHFDEHARQRALQHELERGESRDNDPMVDPLSPDSAETESQGVVSGLIRRATGFDKDYDQIRYITFRRRSESQPVVSPDDALQGEEPQSRLRQLGESFVTTDDEREQSRALDDARTVFELQHPPSKIVKYRRNR